MSSKPTKPSHPVRPGSGPAPGSRDAGEAVWRASLDPVRAGPTAMAEAELRMSDLVADADGEVVFFNDSGLRRLAIATDAAVVGDGRAGVHRTAAGQNVSGFRFLTFDNGVTFYYEAGLDVVVRGAR